MIETLVFGQLVKFFSLGEYGDSYELNLPDWSGRMTRVEMLEGLDDLIIFLTTVRAQVSAQPTATPDDKEQPDRSSNPFADREEDELPPSDDEYATRPVEVPPYEWVDAFEEFDRGDVEPERKPMPRVRLTLNQKACMDDLHALQTDDLGYLEHETVQAYRKASNWRWSTIRSCLHKLQWSKWGYTFPYAVEKAMGRG